jgi:CheY-like chemotaxis protein
MLSEALLDYLTREIPHRITCFATGEEAIARLYEKPDIIILDYYLDTEVKSAANGMEVLRVIREKLPNTPVIMLSGQEKYAVAAQTLQKGAVQYVIKGDNAFAEIAELVGMV